MMDLAPTIGPTAKQTRGTNPQPTAHKLQAESRPDKPAWSRRDVHTILDAQKTSS